MNPALGPFPGSRRMSATEAQVRAQEEVNQSFWESIRAMLEKRFGPDDKLHLHFQREAGLIPDDLLEKIEADPNTVKIDGSEMLRRDAAVKAEPNHNPRFCKIPNCKPCLQIVIDRIVKREDRKSAVKADTKVVPNSLEEWCRS